MIKQLLIGALVAAGLTGCGGDSSSNSDDSSFRTFTLSDYESRVVDTTIIDGTWVAVSSGGFSSNRNEGGYSSTYSGKEFFIIRSDAPNLLDGSLQIEKSNCWDTNEVIEINGNTISYSNFQGTLSNNSAFSGTFKEEHNDTEINLQTKDIATVKAIKISDSVESFGSLIINSQNNGIITKAVDCFHQISGSATYEGATASFNEYRAGVEFENGAVSMEKYNSNPIFTWFDGFVSGLDDYLHLNSDEGDSFNFSLDSETSLSLGLSFNGSSDTESVTGSIQLQLPAQ